MIFETDAVQSPEKWQAGGGLAVGVRGHGEAVCGLREDPVVREEEVGEATCGDGDGVRENDGHVGGVDEDVHEREVAEQRDEAVGEMEAEELCERVASGVLRCFGPGVVQVPDEVVKERELDGEGGSEEVVAREGVVEDGECSELGDDAEDADEVEAEESCEWAHRFLNRKKMGRIPQELNLLFFLGGPRDPRRKPRGT